MNVEARKRPFAKLFKELNGRAIIVPGRLPTNPNGRVNAVCAECGTPFAFRLDGLRVPLVPGCPNCPRSDGSDVTSE